MIIKTSKKIVHGVAGNVTPLLLKIQHKKDTKKYHIKLTARLILVIKAMVIVIPIILTFTSQFIEKQSIDFFIAMYVSLWLACFSLIFFVIQYSLANILSVKRQELR
jgi:hypothetical protein